jgi:coatomer subunit beta'
MQVEFNPKDTNTFASASLDRTIKVWGLNSNQAHFSLEGHERGACSPAWTMRGVRLSPTRCWLGVNCVSYFRGGEMPYLVSGADDQCVVRAACAWPAADRLRSLVKVWDYQTKACVATMDGHTNNVSSAVFHPQLPVIISGSEDGTVRVWHSTTYRLENTLNYGTHTRVHMQRKTEPAG